jgi:hypothetical protein
VWVRRWGAEGRDQEPQGESEEVGQQPGGRRAGVKPAGRGRAWGGAAMEAEGRDGLAAAGREARPARGWNYNRVEGRGAGLKQFSPRPPRKQTARPSPVLVTPNSALPRW